MTHMPAVDVQALIEPYLPSPMPTEKLSATDKENYLEKIKALLKKEDAVLIAHYYVDQDIQALAEATGGCVADSLEMARFGRDHEAKTLVVAGVRFMGETAKILSPEKRVLMPTLKAECSLDLSCPPESFATFCGEHPDRTVVVYANTSAAIKALADWVVTSSCATEIIEHLHEQGEKIIWGPDRYLGGYLKEKTGADMLLWQGSCIVHENFKAGAITQLKTQYPEAAVLVHPESPMEAIKLADVVGSTSGLLKASQRSPNKQFLVATEHGILYKMQQASPEKEFIGIPSGGVAATCESCAHCPWMKMNVLENLYDCLEQGSNEVLLDAELCKQAVKSLNRMLAFQQQELS